MYNGKEDWDYSAPTSKYLKLCKHVRQPVLVGQAKVWATAWTDMSKVEYPLPDLGVYLDSCWLGEASVAYVYGAKVQPPKAWYPSILVDWRDYSAPDMDTLQWLAKTARKAILRGEQVEIGCLGGHGRTGTLLAVLIGQIEGLHASKAIDAVRQRLCSSCVESYCQEAAVYKMLGERPPKKPPLLPPAPPAGAAYRSYTFHDGVLWERFWNEDGTFEEVEHGKAS